MVRRIRAGLFIRERDAPGSKDLAEQGGAVGNDAIHTLIQFPLHILFFIDGPGHHLHGEAVGVLYIGSPDFPVIGGKNIGPRFMGRFDDRAAAVG